MMRSMVSGNRRRHCEVGHRAAPLPCGAVPRVRLDSLLAERGLFASRTRAAAAVIAGQVHVGPGRARAAKPGQLVAADVELDVDAPPPFVSRGGVKLATALDALGIDVTGAGRSTSAPRPGGSRTACCSAAPRTWWRSTSPTASSTGGCASDERVTVVERVNARALEPSQLPFAPDLVVVDVSFISLTKVLPAVLACAAERFDCLAMVKPQFEVGRGVVGKGGVVRDAELRRGAIAARRASGARRRPGLRGVRPARPGGQPRDVRVAGGAGPPGRGRRRRCRARGDGRMRAATVLTHRRVSDTAGPLQELIAAARRAGVLLRFDADETSKHGLVPAEGIELDSDRHDDVDLCLVMGGDGTILTALRVFTGTGVPVFAVNFGEVGFLATVDPDGLAAHFDRAFAGDFEMLQLPTIAVGRPEGTWTAMNDISVHRKPGHRVADLAYGLAGEEIGRVRCDGLVVATPQGSTGYNLANGGPVMAWGVEGYVVSFVAPHSLTARALVIAPGDLLTINNASREEPVEVHVDGRPSCELPPGEDLHVDFAASHGTLAQLPGASFYHRLRERFGRLAR